MKYSGGVSHTNQEHQEGAADLVVGVVRAVTQAEAVAAGLVVARPQAVAHDLVAAPL